MAGDVLWLEVLPAFGGFGKELTSKATAAARDAGSASGGAWAKSFDASAGDGGTKNVVAELERAQKQAEKAVSDASRNIGLARATQREATAKVVAAEDAYAEACRKSGEDSAKAQVASLKLEAARDRERVAALKVESAEGAVRAAYSESKQVAGLLEQATQDVTDGADEQVGAWDRLKGSMSGARSGFSDTEAGLGSMVGQLAAAAGGVALLKEGFDQALESRAGNANTAASLGLTPEQATAAGDAAGKLYAGAYGDSMTDVSAAVETVMSSISGMRDASAADIEMVTGQALSMAQAFDIDVSDAAAAAGGMIKNGLAPDAAGAFDLITASLQRVPEAMRGDVLDAANEYGTFFAGLGLSGEQAMSMLVAASDGGQIAIDKTGDAIKEFVTLAGSDLERTGPVFEKLGFNAAEMSGAILAGGDTAAGAFQQIVDGLLGMTDPSEQAQAAIALFGTPLEDLNVSEIPGFLEGLSSMESGLGDVTGKAGELDDKMAETVSPIESLKRSFVGVLTDGVEPLLGPISSFSEWAKENPGLVQGVALALGGVAAAVTAVTVAQTAWTAAQTAWQVATKVGTGIQVAFNAVMNANPIMLIVTAVGALVAGLVYFFTQTETGKAAWESFTNAIGVAWEWVSTKLGEGWEWIKSNVFEPVQSGIGWVGERFVEVKDGIGTAWEAVKTGLKAGWDFIYQWVIAPYVAGFQWAWDKVVAVKDGVVTAWNLLRDGVKAGWDFIYQWVVTPYVNGFQWIWDKVVAVKDGVVTAWNLMRDGIQAGWNWVRDKVFMLFESGVAAVGTAFETAKGVITGAWDAVKTGVSVVWDWIRDNVFDRFTRGVENIGKAFEGARDTVKTAWNQLGNIARRPVNFIIDTVYNNGIKKVFDDIAEAVGLKLKLPTVGSVPEFAAATGGIMPGYTPGRDVHTFVSPTAGVLHLSGGEPILRPEAGRVLGSGWVHGINAAARSGGTAGVQQFLGGGDHHHYALGGIVDWLGNAASNVGTFISNTANGLKDAVVNTAAFLANPVEGMKALIATPVNKLLETIGGSAFVDSLVEVPPKVVDGLITKVKDLVAGMFSSGGGDTGGSLPDMTGGRGFQSPSRGRMTSRYGPRNLLGMTFHNGVDYAGGGQTYAAGAGQVARVGWNVSPAGNTGIGILLNHGGGLQTYYGHNPSMAAVQVRPGDMVQAGQHIGYEGKTGQVTGVHLHFGAFRNGQHFNPLTLFDQGGWMMPGEPSVNLTGKPEPVLNAQQWADIHQLAREGGSDGPVVAYLSEEQFDRFLAAMSEMSAVTAGRVAAGVVTPNTYGRSRW